MNKPPSWTNKPNPSSKLHLVDSGTGTSLLVEVSGAGRLLLHFEAFEGSFTMELRGDQAFKLGGIIRKFFGAGA